MSHAQNYGNMRQANSEFYLLRLYSPQLAIQEKKLSAEVGVVVIDIVIGSSLSFIRLIPFEFFAVNF